MNGIAVLYRRHLSEAQSIILHYRVDMKEQLKLEVYNQLYSITPSVTGAEVCLLVTKRCNLSRYLFTATDPVFKRYAIIQRMMHSARPRFLFDAKYEKSIS